MSIVLTATDRTTGSHSIAQNIRATRKIPAIVYGPDLEGSRALSVDAHLFQKAFREAGESTLVELDFGTEKIPTLIKAVQTNPVTNAFTHVDFFAVSMKKELETDVSLEFTGESEAVKHMGGTLLKIKDAVTVRCLPIHLVRTIAIPLEALSDFDAVITIGDIKAPEGVTILDEADEVVAKVSAPLTEDQLKAMEAANAADVTKVEVVGKKKEDEAAATDAAAKPGAKAAPAAKAPAAKK